MKHADFDGRLDGIMVRAAVRLHERMAFAFARGRLADYLRRIGLAEELHLGKQHNVNLAEIEEEVLLLLAAKLRRARKTGTLRSLLRQLNMTELLPGNFAEKAFAPCPASRPADPSSTQTVSSRSGAARSSVRFIRFVWPECYPGNICRHKMREILYFFSGLAIMRKS